MKSENNKKIIIIIIAIIIIATAGITYMFMNKGNNDNTKQNKEIINIEEGPEEDVKDEMPSPSAS